MNNYDGSGRASLYRDKKTRYTWEGGGNRATKNIKVNIKKLPRILPRLLKNHIIEIIQNNWNVLLLLKKMS